MAAKSKDTEKDQEQTPAAVSGDENAAAAKPRKAAVKKESGPQDADLPTLDGTPVAERRRNKATAGDESVKVESDRDLVAAPLEAPRAQKATENVSAPLPSTHSPSMETLRMVANATRITTVDDEYPNADEVFTGPTGAGHYVTNMRLMEHTKATMYDRPVRRLLLAKGTTIPAPYAESLKSRLRAQAGE